MTQRSEASPEKSKHSSKQGSPNLLTTILRLLIMMFAAGFGSVAVWLLLGDGYWQLATMVGIISVFFIVIFYRQDTEALRWLSPGLALFLLFVLFPLIVTIFFAFTNYATSNSLTKIQVIRQFEQRTYLPEDGVSYEYTMFFDESANEYALWLVAEDGTTRFVKAGEDITLSDDAISETDDNGNPLAIGDYVALGRGDAAKAMAQFGDSTTFGTEPNDVALSRSRFGVAVESEQRYTYDSELDALVDNQSGINYIADGSRGFFINPDDSEDRIPVGYQVWIGFRNFERFLTSPIFRGPILRVTTWNFAFAILSVFFSFTLGLVIAIVFGKDMPGEKVIKAGLILPWAVPQVITLLIWKGMWNPLNGVIANMIADVARFFGADVGVGWPPVFADPTWAKIAILVVNVWLAYPYFMLVCSGALQAIPSDLYEAAQIDGANAWQRFWNMTLPLLLLSVGPLLIGSFTANFNSFNVIYLFNDGGPSMTGTPTPVGHTDILLSYVYKLSFGGGSGQQEFGFAAAITIVIFVFLAAITAFNLRYMNIWEETGQNV